MSLALRVLLGRSLLALLPAAALASTVAVHAAPASQEVQTAVFGPAQIGTVSQTRCDQQVLSTPGVECRGFDGRDVRSLDDLWVVGFENNAEVKQKHVMQTVVMLDLAAVRAALGGAAPGKAVLGYAEASTARRSAAGESQDGILPTCNTGLGVPVDGWDGSLDRLVPTRPAGVAGVAGATTGDVGGWDVTPQLQAWLAGPAERGVLVLRGDDESLDIRGQGMCLSYVFDIGLAVEFTPGG